MEKQALIKSTEHKCSLRSMLHPGNETSENKEIVADCILALPRELWISRRVRFSNNVGHVETEDTYATLTRDCWNCMPASPAGFPFGVVALANSAVFVGASLVGLLFLVVGLPIKKYALKNPRAKAYNNMIHSILLSHPIMQQIEILEKEVCHHQNLLTDTQNKYDALATSDTSGYVSTLVEKEKAGLSKIINTQKTIIQKRKDEIELLRLELAKIPSLEEAIIKYRSLC